MSTTDTRRHLPGVRFGSIFAVAGLALAVGGATAVLADDDEVDDVIIVIADPPGDRNPGNEPGTGCPECVPEPDYSDYDLDPKPFTPCWQNLTSMPNARVSGVFGEQRGSERHGGVDIAVPTGTELFALEPGTVAQIGEGQKEGENKTKNGNFVRIDYESGAEGVYLHMLEPIIEKGKSVDAGTLLGYSNDTGDTTGTHVHYTHYADGNGDDKGSNPVDPQQVYNGCDDN